jgi:hypothetical protein
VKHHFDEVRIIVMVEAWEMNRVTFTLLPPRQALPTVDLAIPPISTRCVDSF